MHRATECPTTIYPLKSTTAHTHTWRRRGQDKVALYRSYKDTGIPSYPANYPPAFPTASCPHLSLGIQLMIKDKLKSIKSIDPSWAPHTPPHTAHTEGMTTGQGNSLRMGRGLRRSSRPDPPIPPSYPHSPHAQGTTSAERNRAID